MVLVCAEIESSFESPTAIVAYLSLHGYALTSRVTLERPDLRSRFGDHLELAKLLLSVPIVTVLAPAITLSSPVTLQQWLIYVSAFSSGLNFTYVDNNKTLQSLGCKFPVPKLWKTITAAEFTLLASTLLALGVGAIGISMEMVRQGLLRRVINVNVGVACATFVYWLYSMSLNRKQVHMHHYIILGILPLCATGCRGIFALIAQGVFLGIYVEGIAVWGMDPLFW